MGRVLNLPLRGADYRAVTTGELRRIQLPTTERTHRLLFGKDDKPKPYTRANVRLGASGQPRQFALVRYERIEGLYFVTLGEPISEVDEETWAATVEVAMLDLIMEYLDSVKGYAVAYEAAEYKRLGRSAGDIVRTYKQACQWSEVGRTAQAARLELSEAFRSEIIHIWRGCHNALLKATEGKDSYLDMKAEALTALALCRYLLRFHKERGGKLGAHYGEIARGVLPLFRQYAAPYDLPEAALKVATTALDAALVRYRKKSQIIKN